MSPQTSLRLIKVVHTMVWAFFAGCIVAIPVCTWRDELGAATVLIAIVLVEVLVILINRWRCPLTDVAARYTSDRQDNFDIYLPLWLARYNKQIFGTLYVVSLLHAGAKWQHWLP